MASMASEIDDLEDLPLGWTQQHDPANGTFYLHKESGVTTFENPHTVVFGGWVRLIDPESACPYYFDMQTYETCWECPKAFSDARGGNLRKTTPLESISLKEQPSAAKLGLATSGDLVVLKPAATSSYGVLDEVDAEREQKGGEQGNPMGGGNLEKDSDMETNKVDTNSKAALGGAEQEPRSNVKSTDTSNTLCRSDASPDAEGSMEATPGKCQPFPTRVGASATSDCQGAAQGTPKGNGTHKKVEPGTEQAPRPSYSNSSKEQNRPELSQLPSTDQANATHESHESKGTQKVDGAVLADKKKEPAEVAVGKEAIATKVPGIQTDLTHLCTISDPNRDPMTMENDPPSSLARLSKEASRKDCDSMPGTRSSTYKRLDGQLIAGYKRMGVGEGGYGNLDGTGGQNARIPKATLDRWEILKEYRAREELKRQKYWKKKRQKEYLREFWKFQSLDGMLGFSWSAPQAAPLVTSSGDCCTKSPLLPTHSWKRSKLSKTTRLGMEKNSRTRKLDIQLFRGRLSQNQNSGTVPPNHAHEEENGVSKLRPAGHRCKSAGRLQESRKRMKKELRETGVTYKELQLRALESSTGRKTRVPEIAQPMVTKPVGDRSQPNGGRSLARNRVRSKRSKKQVPRRRPSTAPGRQRSPVHSSPEGRSSQPATKQLSSMQDERQPENSADPMSGLDRTPGKASNELRLERDLRKFFGSIDSSGDGFVSLEGLRHLLSNSTQVREMAKSIPVAKLLLDGELLEYLFASLDADDSGDISLEEFLRVFQANLGESSGEREKREEYQALFRLMDRNHDGSIDMHELKFALRHDTKVMSFLRSSRTMRPLLHASAYHRIIDIYLRFDHDGSGTLEWPEFFQVCQWTLR